MRYTDAVTQSTLVTRALAALWIGIVAAIVAGCQTTPPSAAAGVSTERGSSTSNWWDEQPRAGWQPFTRIAATGDWFDVYRINPRTFAIYEPGQFEEVISYLVVGDERALLIDTGLGIDAIDQLVYRLTNRPVTVVNTHAHYDHVGGNHAFDTIHAHATPFATGRATGTANAEVGEFVSDAWLARPLPSGMSRDSYRIRPYQTPIDVADGERFSLGGISIEVVLTPGHTDDSICLLDRANGVLFTGDTFYPAPLYAHLEGAGLATYQRSLERLAALSEDVTLILPGHNEPVRDVMVLGRAARLLGEIRDGRQPERRVDGVDEHDGDGFSVLVHADDADDE
ncbi:MAG: MBL fold metallo-hydrolase [Pseudomonadota bacterium]